MESSRGIAIAIAIAALLHIAVLAAPLELDVKRAVRRDIEPLVVTLVPPPPAREQPMRPPRAEPARVKRIVKAAPSKPKTAPVPLTTTTEAPSAIVSPELPQVAAAPPTARDPAAAVDPPAPAPPAPLVPPSFNAGYLHNPKPAYPAAARRFGEQGTVLLRVYVSAAGAPDRIQVHSSSGSVRLDQAATETVGGWKFIPARRGSEPVSAWVTVPIIFTLKD